VATPLPIAAVLRRARNAKSPKERHDTAYYAWEALLRLAVAARPPSDPRSLLLPSAGSWAAALLPSLPEAATLDAPACLAALAHLTEAAHGHAKGPRACSPRRLVEALPAYRNALLGHGATRDAAFYEAGAEALLTGLEALLAADALLPSGARVTFVEGIEIDPDGGRRAHLLELGAEGALVRDPRGTRDAPAELLPGRLYLREGKDFRPLHPWLLFDERDGRERVLFWNGRSRGPTYLDYVTGEVVKGRALLEAFPGLERDLAALFDGPGAVAPAATPTPTPTPATEASAQPPAAGGAFATDAGAADRRIDGYVLHERLGAGGMGLVRRAVQESLSRGVAVKLLPPGAGSSEEAVRRFRREVAALSRCDHAHVVKVLDSGEDAHGPWYAMELVQGPDLAQVAARLREGRPLGEALGVAPGSALATAPAAQALAALMRDAARGLAHLHARGITHRDVKPANLMVAADLGRIVVMDLGLAAVRDASRALTRDGGAVMGTLRYAAPEQLSRGPLAVDPRADVYALGASFYELLAGRPVVDAADDASAVRQALLERPPPLRRLAPDVSADLAVIVEKALEKDPARRYESADALAQDLELFLEGRPIRARPPSVGYLLGLALRRNRAASLLGTLALALVVGGPPLALWSRQRAAEAAREEIVAAVRRDLDEATAARGNFDRATAAVSAAHEEDPAKAGGEPMARAFLEPAILHHLRECEAAARLRALVPSDPEVRARGVEASLALARFGVATEQWTLARYAITRARLDGARTEDVSRTAAALDAAESRISEERRAAVSGVLEAARAGRLYESGRTYEDALFAIVGRRHPETAALVAEALEACTATITAATRARYLEAASPTALEARLGEGPIEGLAAAVDALLAPAPGGALAGREAEAVSRAAARLEMRALGALTDAASGMLAPPSIAGLLGAAQARALGPEGFVLARLSCDALGRMGISEPAVAVLARHLAALDHDRLAVAPGEALARLGGAEARAALDRARLRFLSESTFTDRVGAVLATDHSRAWHFDRAGAAPREGAELERALERDPYDADLWLARARLRRASGDPAAAEADLERAIRLAPGNYAALLERAQLLTGQGRVAESLFDWTRAIELRPLSAPTLVVRADIRRRLGDPRGAIDDAERALTLSPRWPVGWKVRAMARADAGDWEGAIADATRALELDPADEDSWYARASARREAGRPADALADIERAIAIDPEDALNLGLRGLIRNDADDAAGFLVDADAAVRLSPDDATLVHNRGLARELTGDLDGALEDYDRALALAPGDAESLAARGDLRRKRGERAEAKADLERALSLVPGMPTALTHRAALRLESGDARGALQDADAVLARRPGNASARFVRARCRLEFGDAEGALEDARKAVALGDERPELQAICNAALVALENRTRTAAPEPPTATPRPR